MNIAGTGPTRSTIATNTHVLVMAIAVAYILIIYKLN